MVLAHRGAVNPATFLAVGVVLLTTLALFFNLRWLGWWERPLARLARRKKTAIAIAVITPLALRALLLPLFPAPQPRVQDEFTLLLAADTFAHGRLTNPQHPNWVHFETMHVLVRPVYASAFPVAHAAVLALGKILFGHPWAGVWIGSAFMSGAICWMLQGWLPPRWALLGALLVVLRFGVSSYWMNSYWGGCVAAAGGALVLGILPRIRRPARYSLKKQAVILGTGVAILANTRPFEGFVFAFLVAAALVVWLSEIHSVTRSDTLRQSVLPLCAVLAVAGAVMGFYFTGITGKPWVLPYSLYRDTRSLAPHFMWQSPRPRPLYNNVEMRNFYTLWEMNYYHAARSSPLTHFWETLDSYWRFFLGPVLSIPLLTLPWLWRDRQARQLLLMAAFFLLALTVEVWRYAHYAAPATGLAILIVLLAMRRLRLWRTRGRRPGLTAVRSVALCCAIFLVAQVLAGPAEADLEDNSSWRWPSSEGMARARILHQLEESPGRHLVFVRYERGHDVGDEWVYNNADIDASRVVWARELDPAGNQSLLRHLTGRQVWLVEPDLVPPRISPWREASFRPMPFVQIGAPGIAAIRSAEQVKRNVLEEAAQPPDTRLNGWQWNYYFTRATGVDGPEVTKECAGPVLFEDWFAWLKRQS